MIYLGEQQKTLIGFSTPMTLDKWLSTHDSAHMCDCTLYTEKPDLRILNQ